MLSQVVNTKNEIHNYKYIQNGRGRTEIRCPCIRLETIFQILSMANSEIKTVNYDNFCLWSVLTYITNYMCMNIIENF